MWTFLLSPLGRRLGAALLVVAVLAGARWYFIAQGKAEGRRAAAAEHQGTLEELRARDRAELVERLTESRARAADAERRALEERRLTLELARALADIRAERAEARRAVDQVADSDLHRRIVAELGQRPVHDLAPGFSFGEERALLHCVTQLPLCEQQVGKAAEQAESLERELGATREQAGAAEARAQALAGYAARLEGHYTTLYNLHAPRRRPWWCVWLCTRPRTLPVPEPSALH